VSVLVWGGGGRVGDSNAFRPVLPSGRMFGRITQKGPSKNVSGWTNQQPNCIGGNR
jgi:hypothetical protein